jgi:hypothetical protein
MKASEIYARGNRQAYPHLSNRPQNWINRGSKEAGPWVGAILWIVETCRRLSLPVRDYLGSVLTGLADFTINRVAELTPNAWLPATNRRNPATL